MQIHLAQYIMWLAAPLLQIAILVFMFRRGLHREYPFFLNYTIWQATTSVALLVFYQLSYSMYYFGYWSTTLISSLLAFAVLHEIFKDAFRPFEALRDLGTILFRWAALVVLLVAGMSAVTASNVHQVDTVTNTILLVQRNVRVMQCGLIFFLLLFSEYLGISRRHILFGIAVGFGCFAAMQVLVATAVSHATIMKHSTLRELNSAAYILACLTWLGYVAYPKSLRAGEVPAEARSKDWNEALEDARIQAPAESLLDTMDRTVEQLLYHREQHKANIAVK
jgi:hypothetical protein